MTNAALATVSETAASATEASNVITVDFANPLTPLSDFARELAAKAEMPEAKDALKRISQGRPDMFYVNPYLIEIALKGTGERWNKRDFTTPDAQTKVASLAATMAVEGFLRQHPIIVKYVGGKLVLRDGERRLRAFHYAINVLGAKFDGVWAIPAPKNRSELDELVDQKTANLTEPFTIFEDGALYQEMLRFTDGKVSTIAHRLGEKPYNIQRALDVYSAPESVKDLIKAGTISVAFALDTLKSVEGDEYRALAIFNAGGAVAEANGKDRVTPKDVRAAAAKSKGVAAPKARLTRDVIGKVILTTTSEEVDDKVIVTFSKDQWTLLKEMIGL